jgi:hypothetical protein
MRHPAWNAANAADEALTSALERAYGENAAAMRYVPTREHTDGAVLAAIAVYQVAITKWLSVIREAREATTARK